MSPLAIILKAESTPDSRKISYETYRKHTVIIVQQDCQLDEWVTLNHIAAPIVIFDFLSVILICEKPYERSSILAGFCNVLSESLYLTQTHWAMECESVFTIMTWNKFRCMKIKKATGEIWNCLKAFRKWNQILRAQEPLANHQQLPRFMIQSPVHLKTNLKTNQMMIRAVKSLRLQPWTSVLHQRNEESISTMKTKSNLFLCWCCLLRVTFFCEADFMKFDYFIIEFSDLSAHIKYQTLAKKAHHIIRGKIHYYLEKKIFQS